MLIRSFAALAAVFLSAGGVGAQASAATAPGAQVTGAAGFPWGTTRAQIIEERGRSEYEKREPEGVVAMTYDDDLLGREVIAVFFVHPRHGMMRGSYAAPVTSAGECLMVLRMFENAVSRRYPDLPSEERTVGRVDEDGCQAALSGQGGGMKVWTDPANGVRIVLSILPGLEVVMLAYTTPEADAWERRKAASKL